MSRKELILLASAVGVGVILWQWGIAAPVIAAGWVANVFDRGRKLSSSTLQDGVIVETPGELYDQAKSVLGFDVNPETYALARMGRSEGVDGMEYRMHVALNDLDQLQATYGSRVYSSVAALMLHSKITRGNDHFSRQSLGKRYSTSKDPYEGDYALAQKVISDHNSGIDPTGGAVKFVDRSGPFYIDGEETDYDGIVAYWSAFTPVSGLPGTTDNFVVFVPRA